MLRHLCIGFPSSTKSWLCKLSSEWPHLQVGWKCNFWYHVENRSLLWLVETWLFLSFILVTDPTTGHLLLHISFLFPYNTLSLFFPHLGHLSQESALEAAEHTAGGPRRLPLDNTCQNIPRIHTRPKSPFSSPVYHLSERDRGRWRISESLSFAFWGIQEISGWSVLHYSAGLNLNQIGHLISLFSHFLAYKHSGEKN